MFIAYTCILQRHVYCSLPSNWCNLDYIVHIACRILYCTPITYCILPWGLGDAWPVSRGLEHAKYLSYVVTFTASKDRMCFSRKQWRGVLALTRRCFWRKQWQAVCLFSLYTGWLFFKLADRLFDDTSGQTSLWFTSVPSSSFVLYLIRLYTHKWNCCELNPSYCENKVFNFGQPVNYSSCYIFLHLHVTSDSFYLNLCFNILNVVSCWTYISVLFILLTTI
jgi:hypothetical protein